MVPEPVPDETDMVVVDTTWGRSNPCHRLPGYKPSASWNCVNA